MALTKVSQPMSSTPSIDDNGTATALTIDSSGNVGIGTSSPKNPSGYGSTYGFLTVAATTGGADRGAFLELVGTGTGTSGYWVGSVGYYTAGNTYAHADIQCVTDSGANTGMLQFLTNANASAGGGTAAMTIDSSGSVAIGTTATSNGKVTISHAAGNSLNLNKTGGAALAFTYAGYANDALIEGLGNGGLRIYTGNTLTERMRIDSSGRVGIGFTNPTESLHVSGTVKATILTTSSDSLHFMDNTNGTANGYINYYGYQTGTTQYRNLIIANGRGSAIATFTGSSLSLNVVGALSKGSGSFKIDHPLKPDTHHLVHSFVEAPQADLYYRGKLNLVDGVATVNIDEAVGMTEGTFVALCRDVQCFTSNEESWTNVRGSVSGNILTIEAQDSSCTDLISWLVVGERQDPHMYDTDWTDDEGRVIVEPEKTEDDLEKEPSPKGE